MGSRYGLFAAAMLGTAAFIGLLFCIACMVIP